MTEANRDVLRLVALSLLPMASMLVAMEAGVLAYVVSAAAAASMTMVVATAPAGALRSFAALFWVELLLASVATASLIAVELQPIKRVAGDVLIAVFALSSAAFLTLSAVKTVRMVRSAVTRAKAA